MIGLGSPHEWDWKVLVGLVRQRGAWQIQHVPHRERAALAELAAQHGLALYALDHGVEFRLASRSPAKREATVAPPAPRRQRGRPRNEVRHLGVVAAEKHLALMRVREIIIRSAVRAYLDRLWAVEE